MGAVNMSKQTIFTGSGVAIVTPMKADGSVNYEKYRELIEWQIESGTDAIIACGTTGESSTLTHEEHIGVMRAAVEQAAGRIPVISGTGSNDTGLLHRALPGGRKTGRGRPAAGDALLQQNLPARPRGPLHRRGGRGEPADPAL